jgi:hypothetical protein
VTALRRRLVALCGGLLLLPVAAAIEPAGDLRQIGADAADRGVPILLAVTRSECGYCETLKREILQPLRLAGDDPSRVLIRELRIDSPTPVIGFEGEPVTAEALASRYDASFTPTVLIVGPDGKELTERMVGINTPEMYGWYLDRAIDAAHTALQGSGKAESRP